MDDDGWKHQQCIALQFFVRIIKKKEFLNDLCNLTCIHFNCHVCDQHADSFHVADEKIIKSQIRIRIKRIKDLSICKSLESQHNDDENELSHSNEEIIENSMTDAIDSIANFKSTDPSAMMGLENVPMECFEIIMKFMIEIHIMSMHKVKVNRQMMEQVGENIKNYHNLTPFFKKSSDNVCSENWLAFVLHESLNVTHSGKPKAVDCSLHEKHWGKNVCLKAQTSWEGMTLGFCNEDCLIVLWARDAPNAFALALETSVSFSQPNNERRKRKNC